MGRVVVTTPAAALSAARRFRLGGVPRQANPLGEGLINATFRVTTDHGGAYVLQRLNPQVFTEPEPLMENVARVTRHLARVSKRPTLMLVEARNGADWIRDESGAAWRCYGYLAGGRAWSRPPDARIAAAGAEAFGRFCADLGGLAPSELHQLLPGFHDTPRRLAALEDAVARDVCGRAASAMRELDAIRARAERAGLLQEARRRGELSERVAHNDTKFNNVLFRQRSAEVLCVIDLDTVMPGLLVHDFGDLVRSAAARGEGDGLGLDLDLAAALTAGFLAGAAAVLGPADRHYLAGAPQVLALELAARFLTDYLEGDRYFRTATPGENLQRCKGQLALLKDMERREPALRRLVDNTA